MVWASATVVTGSDEYRTHRKGVTPFGGDGSRSSTTHNSSGSRDVCSRIHGDITLGTGTRTWPKRSSTTAMRPGTLWLGRTVSLLVTRTGSRFKSWANGSFFP